MDYSTLSAEELALTCFRSGDDQAWFEFVRRFQPLIARVVFRVARQWGETSPQLVDDLIQDTYVKLCSERQRLLDGFAASHSDAVYGFIKVLTVNLVHDHFRASRAEKRGGWAIDHRVESHDVMPDLADSSCAERVLERKILMEQVDAFLKALPSGPYSDRDRKIFWLYYRVGLTAAQIAAAPGIALSTKGVETVLLRVTRHVREHLAGRPGTKHEDGDSREGIRPAEAL